MKTVGIIAEYNPLHNGHKYQIQKAREITGADTVIVIMSGNFTQQGNIAIIDKFKRAELAIKEGADLVLEIPTIYATASAELFAFSSINILNSLNFVDYIVFGAECNSLDTLQSIAKKLTTYEDTIYSSITNNIQTGKSYVSLRHDALKKVLSKNELWEISKPNNILGIEYLKALTILNSNITPVVVERIGAEHNDSLIKNCTVLDSKCFSSGTAIRNFLGKKQGKVNIINELRSLVPNSTLDVLSSSKLVFSEDMFKLLRYKIINEGAENIKKIYEVVEGLENKICKAAQISTSYEELVLNIKSKRFTASRIRRILVHILLNINDSDIVKNPTLSYARILKVGNKNLLSKISKTSIIPLISSIKKQNISILEDDIKNSIKLDMFSTDIYNVIKNSSLGLDKTNMI